MNRAASLVFLVVGAWAVCDTSTCLTCQKDPSCGWYTATGFADCRKNDTALASLGLTYTPMGMCPACQAGSCSDCQNQTACAWYTHPVLSATCASNSSVPPSPGGVGSYSLLAQCPPCKDTTDCATCNALPNNCSWYALPGSSGGKCSEASPGFAYSKVTTSFCNGGNPCAGIDTCTKCQAVNGTVSGGGMGNPCVWLAPKSGFTSFYNSKCDYNAGTFDNTFYTQTGMAQCPVCTGTNCVTCKAESGCKWSAVSVGGLLSFGQCLQTTTATPGGKTDIAVCPAACKLYSCAQCVANTDCRWFTGSGAGLDDTCDRASDTNQHPFTTVVSDQTKCPQCKSSRCFECNNEPNGCGWYVNTAFGADLPGTGDCAKTHGASSTERLVPNTDKKCDGANGAGSLYPSLMAFIVAIFVYHN